MDLCVNVRREEEHIDNELTLDLLPGDKETEENEAL